MRDLKETVKRADQSADDAALGTAAPDFRSVSG
jgi:hypothetical protein